MKFASAYKWLYGSAVSLVLCCGALSLFPGMSVIAAASPAGSGIQALNPAHDASHNLLAADADTAVTGPAQTPIGTHDHVEPANIPTLKHDLDLTQGPNRAAATRVGSASAAMGGESSSTADEIGSLRFRGFVGPSFYRSARACGAPIYAIEAYLRAMSQAANGYRLGPKDQFDIILAPRRAAAGKTETGSLLYAALRQAGGATIQLVRWGEGGRAQWLDASGAGRQTAKLQRPVFGSISSGYGMRRHPIFGYARMHKGMDFRSSFGAPILAATDGRVVRAGWAGGYGRQVQIQHAGGLTTSYSHMSRISAEPGDTVRRGQVVGYVGSTGLSTGPHLHYEMHRNGYPVDPMSVEFAGRAQLSGSDLDAFRGRLRSLLGVKPVV